MTVTEYGPGKHNYTVPAGVFYLTVQAQGARGYDPFPLGSVTFNHADNFDTTPSGTNTTTPWPPGVLIGDTLFVFCMSTPIPTVIPAGWTQFISETYMTAWYKTSVTAGDFTPIFGPNNNYKLSNLAVRAASAPVDIETVLYPGYTSSPVTPFAASGTDTFLQVVIAGTQPTLPKVGSSEFQYWTSYAGGGNAYTFATKTCTAANAPEISSFNNVDPMNNLKVVKFNVPIGENTDGLRPGYGAYVKSTIQVLPGYQMWIGVSDAIPKAGGGASTIIGADSKGGGSAEIRLGNAVGTRQLVAGGGGGRTGSASGGDAGQIGLPGEPAYGGGGAGGGGTFELPGDDGAGDFPVGSYVYGNRGAGWQEGGRGGHDSHGYGGGGGGASHSIGFDTSYIDGYNQGEGHVTITTGRDYELISRAPQLIMFS